MVGRSRTAPTYRLTSATHGLNADGGQALALNPRRTRVAEEIAAALNDGVTPVATMRVNVTNELGALKTVQDRALALKGRG